MMKIMNRKSQVTVYIIIGILFLVAAALFFYIRAEKIKLEAPAQQETAEVPLEFQALNSYIEGCIIKTGTEALIKIGNSGGYTNLEENNIKANPEKPTESNALLFFPQDKNTEVAYWNYFKSKNNCMRDCECSSERPKLHKSQGSPSIEGQIDGYINSNLKACLDDFKTFRQMGFDISEMGSVKTDARVAESDLIISVEYPLKAKIGGSEKDLKDYRMEFGDIDLRNIYDLASQIVETEERFSYVERWSLEQLTVFGLGTDLKKLPPTTAAVFEPGKAPVRWSVSETRNKIQNFMLPYYVPFFQVFNTANYMDRTGSYYERATIPIASRLGKEYSALAVNFEYMSWWPIYLRMTGRGIKGDIIGPETGAFSLFSWIGLQRYESYYDLSYPIRVDVYDADAFNKKGYHFYFGLESNIRDNKALNCSANRYTLTAPPAGSLLCAPEQACANITIEVVDANNAPVDNVLLTYGASEACEAGWTKLVNGKAVAKVQLPQCIGLGCSLVASKENYFSYPLSYSVRCSASKDICSRNDVLCNGENITIVLEGTKSIDVSLKKMRYMKTSGWSLDANPVPLLNNEMALITLEKTPENNYETDFIAEAIINGANKSKLMPGILPGTYKATINLFYNLPDSTGRKEVVFKEVKTCIKKDVFGNCEEYQTLGPLKFNESFMEGFIEYNLTFAKENIDNAKEIVFYVISSPDSSSFELLDFNDVEQVAKSDELAKTYRANIEPTYLKK